jgi:hypothetical protein
MAMKKVSVTLDAGLVAEIKSEVGERGFSAYLNDALVRRRQRERFAQLERELTEEFGPVPEEVREQVRKEWDELKRRTAWTG